MKLSRNRLPRNIGTIVVAISMPEFRDFPEHSAAVCIREKEIARLPHQGKREMERRRKRMEKGQQP